MGSTTSTHQLTPVSCMLPQEARANVSKRKASDAALPALDAAASAAADEVSPPKRIKAQGDATDKQASAAFIPLSRSPVYSCVCLCIFSSL